MTEIANGLDKSSVAARLHDLIKKMPEDEQQDLLWVGRDRNLYPIT